MTASPPPEPEHTGLRPLSPWGEGYCRHCCFVVGLGPDGLLDPHTRRGVTFGEAKPCKGSDTRPPKVTPYSSRKAAFTTRGQKGECAVCGRRVWLLTDGRLADHSRSVTAIGPCYGGRCLPR